MRGTLEGLPTRAPIIGQLPAIYQEDEFTRQFTGGFDDVLAPVFAILDSLEVYVDPFLTPADFLPWLASWVGVVLAEDWPLDRQRTFIARAVELYRLRGTVAGLRAEVELFTGGTVDISETGGIAVSQSPGGRFPGEDVPRLALRVMVDDPSTVNQTGLDAIVAASKPAHIVHRVEIVGSASGES
jgi:phage tail-like protein